MGYGNQFYCKGGDFRVINRNLISIKKIGPPGVRIDADVTFLLLLPGRHRTSVKSDVLVK